MDKDKKNVLNEKDDFLMKDCQKLVENAREIIQCPVCFENSDEMEQCISGHLICLKCKQTICTNLNSCPFCKKIYSGTKSFIMPDLSKTLSSLKISLDILENNSEKKPNSIEAYRNLIKKILMEMSLILNRTSGMFQILNNCLKNPNYLSQKQMEKQMISLTTQLQNLEHFMKNTEDTLISLKE